MQFIHSSSTVSNSVVFILSLPAFATLGALSSSAASGTFEAESGGLGTAGYGNTKDVVTCANANEFECF